jgi:hypothetical protein
MADERDDLLGAEPQVDGETWDTLPPFATAEHQKLFQVVTAERVELEKLKQEAIENDERVSIMTEHLKNVQQELQHTQVHCLA